MRAAAAHHGYTNGHHAAFGAARSTSSFRDDQEKDPVLTETTRRPSAHTLAIETVLSYAKFKPATTNGLINEDSFCGQLSLQNTFQFAVLGAIVLNAVWIGVEVSWSQSDGYAFYVEQVFAILFSIELIVRIAAYRRKVDFFLDPQQRMSNVFDLVLVALLVLDTYVLSMLFKGAVDMPMISTLRLVRLLRIVRVLRFIPELAIMVKSMLAALRSVSMTFVLTMLIMYVFAVAFTMWAREHKQQDTECEGIECVDVSFGTIPRSFITLLQVVCYDNTFVVIRAIGRESLLYGGVLIIFLVIVAFTLLNILIGIICEIVASTKELEKCSRMKADVDGIFSVLLPKCVDGRLAKSYFVDEGKAVSLLETCGVPAPTLASALSLAADNDRAADGCVDLERLKSMIFKLQRAPEVLDVLLCQQRIDRVQAQIYGSHFEDWGQIRGKRLGSEKAAALDARLGELESLLRMPAAGDGGADCGSADLKAGSVENVAADAGTTFGAALSDLGVALDDLKVRLEGCWEGLRADDTASSNSSHGAASFDIPGGAGWRPRELRHWHQASNEVIRSIHSAMPLVAKFAAH